MPKVESSEYASFGVIVSPPDRPEPPPPPKPTYLTRADICKKLQWSEACIDLALDRFKFPNANARNSDWFGGRDPLWREDVVDQWWATLRDDLRTLKLVK